jgi:hypothetical protein
MYFKVFFQVRGTFRSIFGMILLFSRNGNPAAWKKDMKKQSRQEGKKPIQKDDEPSRLESLEMQSDMPRNLKVWTAEPGLSL